MTPRRIKLADGTKLSANFSQRVWDALDRASWLEGLPPLRRNFIRFRASDGSIHDVPRRFIGDALGIDLRWCYVTGTPQNFRILENAALKEHDRQVFRTLRLMFIAAQNL